MENSKSISSRRGFIRNTLFTASILMVTLRIGANKNLITGSILSCGTNKKIPAPQSSINSIKSGNWSDPGIWGGRIPSSTDTPVIGSGHTIVYDLDETTVLGLMIGSGGTLSFENTKTRKLISSKNVIVEGKLIMRPASVSVHHTLQFIDVNEKNFVGGGMNVLDTDIGMWVMGDGALELVGMSKTSWTNASGDVAKGATTITVNDAAGWKEGDEISIAPMETPNVGAAYATGFDVGTITKISGNTITIDKPTARPHLTVNNKWTAEVINLSRNVHIEGTPQGHSHIYIRSTQKQNVLYTAIRHMGARKDRNGDDITELVSGRYGLHFHHCEDGSRGSLVKGNVIRDNPNHCYVPHASHQITFKDNVSYNSLETAFWWDPGDSTHEVVYDHNIVALCKYLPGSLNMNAEDAPTFSSSGFGLNTGDGNVAKNNVVVGGGQGDYADGGAYNWEAVVNEGVWVFKDNLSHNNDNGLRVWQNSTRNHVIENFTSYYNTMGLFHGAYANSYTYNGGILYGNVLQIKAASVNSNRVRIENFVIDGAGLINHGVEIIHSPLPGERPVFLRNITVKNCKVAGLIDTVEPEVHSADIIQCDIQGSILLDALATANETIRVQPANGQPYQISKSGTTPINAFAPTLWGTGIGLKGEYFNSSDFTSPALTRTDSNVSFSEWSAGVHYAIKGSTYSVRWTGQVQPQFNENYVFSVSAGGGLRLWIDNNQVIDSWTENPQKIFNTDALLMEAGKKYDIKIEYFNTKDDTGVGLAWSSASLPLEYIPQSQLYSEELAGLPEPPDPPGTPGVPGTDPGNTTIVATIAHTHIEVHNQENSSYQLFDTLGRLLKKGSVNSGTNLIDVSVYAKGVLLLKLNKVSKAYKVVKI